MNAHAMAMICSVFLLSGTVRANQQAAEYGKEKRILILVRDAIGKTVTLSLKAGGIGDGTFLSANGTVIVLEKDGQEERFSTSSVRSITVRPGISEALMTLLSSALMTGLGYGIAVLSFGSASSGVQAITAGLFGIVGLWIGYGTFFQPEEIALP